MKNLLFLLILNVPFLNAQTYDFNYLISYSVESLTCKGESVMYVSTKNENYYLSLTKRDNILTARLTDYESKKLHVFKVKETNKNNEVLFDFQYDYTLDMKYFNQMKVSKNEYSIVSHSAEEDPNIRNLELQVYKNSRRKKLESKFSIEVKKSDNLFSAFEHCCIHPHQFIKKESPENILVSKATETTRKGSEINYRLKTLKEVNLKLVIPQTNN